MNPSRLTFFGLALVLIGWGMLLFGEYAAQKAAPFMRTLPVAIDLARPEIAQNLILSGFGLAILGALRSGVRALTSFFEAVLQRSAAARAEPAAAPVRDYVDPNIVVERGRVRNRPYAVFADGSVEVETLIGPRRFASLADAEEFVGT